MQGGQVIGVDYADLQHRADALFQKQMQHHAERAFGNPPWRTLFRSAIPFADSYSTAAPLLDAHAPQAH